MGGSSGSGSGSSGGSRGRSGSRSSGGSLFKFTEKHDKTMNLITKHTQAPRMCTLMHPNMWW